MVQHTTVRIWNQKENEDGKADFTFVCEVKAIVDLEGVVFVILDDEQMRVLKEVVDTAVEGDNGTPNSGILVPREAKQKTS